MKNLRVAALLCVVFVLLQGCTSNKTEPGGQVGTTGAQKVVTLVLSGANCVATSPGEPNGQVKISRGAGDHVRWTASQGLTFRVTFKDETPCHRSAAAGSAAVASYKVEGGHESDQCFALKDTPKKQYNYLIENLTSGTPVVCADPAVIVEN